LRFILLGVEHFSAEALIFSVPDRTERGIGLTHFVALIVPLATRTDEDVSEITARAHLAPYFFTPFFAADFFF
jgi:hypothetical protein